MELSILKRWMKNYKMKKQKPQEKQSSPPPNHNDGCECEVCKFGIDEVQRRDAVAMEEYGWIIHFILSDDKNSLPNIHTHGFVEKFNHPDVQICFNISPRTASSILNYIAEVLATGEKFETGKRYPKVINNYYVVFADAVESGRHVLRVIFPDANGKFNSTKPYSHQWHGTTTKPID